MAEEIKDTTTDTEGAGSNTPTQDAAGTEQSTTQDQNVSQGSQVDNTGTDASSKGTQGRKNASWAQERILEKTVKKQLQEHLAPILERLSNLQAPPAATTSAPQDELGTPDYNNLNEWLKAAVGKLVEKQVGTALPKSLSEFEGKLKSVSKTQEARNYLLSQEDIGEDEDKLSEVEQIMKREMLDFAAVHQPLKAVQKAVKLWRQERKNPNAPTKQMLSTISGGTGNAGGKKELGVAELIALQKKLASGLPSDELAEVYKQVDSLFV